MKVYVVIASSGTCPSDNWDWVDKVFASKVDAAAYVAAQPEPKPHSGGPWYQVDEHDVLLSQTDAMPS